MFGINSVSSGFQMLNVSSLGTPSLSSSYFVSINDSFSSSLRTQNLSNIMMGSMLGGILGGLIGGLSIGSPFSIGMPLYYGPSAMGNPSNQLILTLLQILLMLLMNNGMPMGGFHGIQMGGLPGISGMPFAGMQFGQMAGFGGFPNVGNPFGFPGSFGAFPPINRGFNNPLQNPGFSNFVPKNQIDQIILQASQRYNVDPALIKA
ncbi:MAG: hypothetical protein RMJ36_05805, partial [Candidatus Calescibacterium sp.]|nr:hypothetical protein [Candidatus Calescibacterium sp.]MDW8133150.1 hypothetical protein [Candidatus Calescibacterium sp.]